MTNKKHISLPDKGKDTALFCLHLARSMSLKDLTLEDVKYTFELEGVEITEDINKEIEEMFPEIKF